ncbi:MAG: hypothetical protein ACRD1P_13120 [Thermoanaerobaculia bacterium]
MKKLKPAVPDGWKRHSAEQTRAWLRLSHAERLAWLEQAKEFAGQARAAARPKRPKDKTPPSA